MRAAGLPSPVVSATGEGYSLRHLEQIQEGLARLAWLGVPSFAGWQSHNHVASTAVSRARSGAAACGRSLRSLPSPRVVRAARATRAAAVAPAPARAGAAAAVVRRAAEGQAARAPAAA